MGVQPGFQTAGQLLGHCVVAVVVEVPGQAAHGQARLPLYASHGLAPVVFTDSPEAALFHCFHKCLKSNRSSGIATLIYSILFLVFIFPTIVANKQNKAKQSETPIHIKQTNNKQQLVVGVFR